jgi:hypothetical protein
MDLLERRISLVFSKKEKKKGIERNFVIVLGTMERRHYNDFYNMQKDKENKVSCFIYGVFPDPFKCVWISLARIMKHVLCKHPFNPKYN